MYSCPDTNSVLLGTFNKAMILKQDRENWQHSLTRVAYPRFPPTEEDLRVAIEEFEEFLSSDVRVIAQALLRATGYRLILASQRTKDGRFSLVCWDEKGLFYAHEPVYRSFHERYDPTDWTETRFLDIRDVVDKLAAPRALMELITSQLDAIARIVDNNPIDD